MYILQLSQGELSTNVGLFGSIEEGRKLISQLTGYQTLKGLSMSTLILLLYLIM